MISGACERLRSALPLPLPRRPHHPLLLLATVFFLACGIEGGPLAEGEDETPVRGGTAVVGLPGDATTLLPPLARTAEDDALAGILFPSLNRMVWEEDGLAYPEGHPLALADRRSIDASGTRLTYHLDPERRWSDGEPVTAGDVVFTYRLLADPDAAFPLSYVTQEMDSVTAAGDTAVTFHFRRRYPGMLFHTGVGILPEHVFGDRAPARVAEHPAALRPGEEELVVGGPFRVAAWDRDERIVLVRNERSVIEPRLDSVVFRVLPDETTRVAELRTGGVDVARIGSHRRGSRLAESEEIRIERMPRRAYDYIAWNPSGHPAFDDPDARRALSLAIDRSSILEALEMEAFAEPAYGPYGSIFPDLRPERPETLHDRERARELLEGAGWRDGDGDGVREREGAGEREELAFELAIPAANARRSSAAQMIQAQLAEVGARAEIRTQEFASLFQRARTRDYEAALLGWQVGLDPDIAPFWYDPESPLNVVSYDSPGARRLMDSAQAAPDRETAADWWRRVGERIAADHPYAFLWHFDLLVAVGPDVRGVEADALGYTDGIHEWWTP